MQTSTIMSHDSLSYTVPLASTCKPLSPKRKSPSFFLERDASIKFRNVYYKILDDILFGGNMPFLRKCLDNFEFYPMNSVTGNKEEGICELLVWYSKKIPHMLAYCMDILFRGVGQVYLCNHPITGLFVCIGLYLTSKTLLVYALVGTAGSTLGGYYFSLPEVREITGGLFGYDGTLTGCAVYTFLSMDSNHFERPSLTNNGLLLVLFLSTVAGIFRNACMNLNKLPALTLAFNMVTVCYLLILAHQLSKSAYLPELVGDAEETQDDGTAINNDEDTFARLTMGYLVDALLRGIGQFCFVSDTVGSVFVLLGIAICNRRSAYMAVLGSLVGFVASRFILSLPASMDAAIRQGLLSYNAMGCCVAIAGDVFYVFNAKSVGIGVISSAITVFLQLFVTALFTVLGGGKAVVPVCTVPFVLSTWLLMMTKSEWLIPRVEGDADLDDAMYLDRRHDHDSWYRRKTMLRPTASLSQFMSGRFRFNLSGSRVAVLHNEQPPSARANKQTAAISMGSTGGTGSRNTRHVLVSSPCSDAHPDSDSDVVAAAAAAGQLNRASSSTPPTPPTPPTLSLV
mmetsp:Transcript_20507/g.34314  ORF Transcript_20507/g.34314 Transcript_20507/m.34314 type:complete len:569 (+) Transcript_20507:180-1886(+)